MAQNKTRIFISSSSDLADSRKDIANTLKCWLQRIGYENEMEPYLWDEATENGDLLSDRQDIQPQLPDPLDWSVPFTICLFGERCGVPLKESLPEHWLDRLKPWRATDDQSGLVHPWPLDDEMAQVKLLDRGDFPLTGTIFELISACAAPENNDNLIVCYSASNFIEVATSVDDLFFNGHKEHDRLRCQGRTPGEQSAIICNRYNPQILALLNFLKHFITHKNGNPNWCVSEAEMRKKVVERAKKKLRGHYGLESEHNPFKLSLDHWKLGDPELPGRQDLVNKVILPLLVDTSGEEKRPLVLITGPSGCGKSSVLQRGVLGALERKGMMVLPIRPTDLEGVGEKDRLDIFWDMLCNRIEGCHIPGMKPHKRDEKMARQLIEVLEYRNIELVIGIDQFEEMLDEMAQFNSKTQRTRGWWLLLRFFYRIAISPRVKLVATLENTRRKTFDTLEIDSVVGLPFRTCSADVTAKEVETIARNGFELGGLTLGNSLLQEIQDKWDAFAKRTSSSEVNASPLPLACLWFAQLYERFEDRAEKTIKTDGTIKVGQEMARANTMKPILTLEDIGGADAVAFEGVIGQLADEAWEEAYGKKPPEGDIVQNAEAYEGFILFLDPLVAFDGEDHIRLLSAPPDGAHKYLEQYYLTFRKRRLLVLTGRQERVRLVHQAVINQWQPAQEWLSWRRSYLKTEYKLLEAAKAWSVGGRRKPRKNTELVQQAAQVLNTNKIKWRSASPKALSHDNNVLRDYCLEHLINTTNGLEPVLTSLSDQSVISIAAEYHMEALLKKLLKSKPEAFFVKDKKGDTLLKKAAPSDGPATKMLIEMAHDRGEREWTRDPCNGWSAIAMAIQEHANANFRLLIKEYDDCNVSVVGDDLTMLHITAMVDNLEVAQDLIQRPGINLNSKDSNKITPISYAAYWGSEKVFRFLLERVDFLNEHEYNPLHRAAFRGHVSIIRAALNSPHLDEETKEKALVDKPNQYSLTPLMEAAMRRHPEALAELLSYCEPQNEVHCKPDGSTLLHLVLSKEKDFAVSSDEQHRAKKCVEILLDNGRIDVMALANGKTAYEIGTAFKDARRVLRQYMPLDYATMSTALRREDLLSSNPKEYRRLIEQAPQVLSDKLGDITGIDLLIKEKRTKTLAEILQKGQAPTFSIRRRWSQLISLASEANEAALRRSLVDVIPHSSKADLSPLLDAALRDADNRENDLVANLLARGVKLSRGTGALGSTVFHRLAVHGDVERFEMLAASHNFNLPLDDWGRAPSELASSAKQDALETLEARYFKGKGAVRKTTADWTPYLALERANVEKLDAATRRKVLAIVRKIDEIPKFDAKKTTTTKFNLPFYKNTDLIVVTNPYWNEGVTRICFLLRDGALTRLAGTSSPIHEFNAKTKFQALKGSIREYLAFFCFFIRGEDGPFLVVDRLDNIFVPKCARTPEFDQAFRPVKLWGRDETGKWRASACVYYSNAMFFADFLIHPSGMVEMVDDSPIASDFDGRVDAPLTL